MKLTLRPAYFHGLDLIARVILDNRNSLSRCAKEECESEVTIEKGEKIEEKSCN